MKNQVRYLQNLFYDLLNDYGLVYIVIRYSDNSRIGGRGFTEEEKKKGLVLVFNQRNHKELQWLEDGSIMATLGFGVNNKPEKCFIHADDIVAVFSPDARVKLDRWDFLEEGESWHDPVSPGIVKEGRGSERKIISLDSFKKQKK
ncbi:MAG: hypothetical protein AB1552_01785 [Nitrospirota bacterium]